MACVPLRFTCAALIVFALGCPQPEEDLDASIAEGDSGTCPVGAECSADADCGDSRICGEDCSCKCSVPAGAQCETNADCDVGDVCSLDSCACSASPGDAAISDAAPPPPGDAAVRDATVPLDAASENLDAATDAIVALDESPIAVGAQPEGVTVLPGGTYPGHANPVALVASQVGVQVVDLVTRSITSAWPEGNQPSPATQAVFLPHDDNPALLLAAPTGPLLVPVDAATGGLGAFAQFLLGVGDNATDACLADDNAALLVDNNNSRVVYMGLDATDSFFELHATRDVNVMSMDASTNAVSACAPGADSRVLVVTDGAPGGLWYIDWDAGITSVGDLENAPRRVRCNGGGTRCFASNFASDSLSVLDWPDPNAGAPTIREHVAVGDGPVGIAVADFGDVTVAATTGFGDNTLHYTIVPASGAIRSESVPLSDCNGPGHVDLLPASRWAVVSCNGDASIVIRDMPESVP